MNYDKNYFIQKFEAIPDKSWRKGGVSTINGACCVLGHLGCWRCAAGSNDYTLTEEARALIRLFNPTVQEGNEESKTLWLINDDTRADAKTNILNKLRSLPV